jgi:hypothetical protein
MSQPGGKCYVETYRPCLLALPIGSSIILAEDLKLPLQKQSTPQAVIDEHFDALNKCDWNRIVAQYPAELICLMA